MCEPLPGSSGSMSSVEVIPASATATHGGTGPATNHQRSTSSDWLASFARALWFGKIRQPSAQMRLGLGGDSVTSSDGSAIESCPSDYERVALGLTTHGIDCSCSPHFRTPTARDWKGMSAKSWRTRLKGDTTPTLPDQIGGTPHPEFVEQLMGFPIGWTDLPRLATASSRKSRSGSAGALSKRKRGL